LRVTVPLLSPQILYIMITSFIGAFKEYNSVIGLFGASGGSFDKTTGPRTMQTIVFYIYEKMGENGAGGAGLASAAAVVLFIIIMAFTIVQRKVSKSRVHY
jgi:multiple sugar transport system permease protein